MKSLVAEVDLLNRFTGRFEAAQLYEGLDDKNLSEDGRSRSLGLLSAFLRAIVLAVAHDPFLMFQATLNG